MIHISALDKKLLRDLLHMWGQALAIAFVMAAGVATLILGTGAYRSLYETREAYYERYAFAHIFANAKRAPNHLQEQIKDIQGVAGVETRISGGAIIDIEGRPQPATGRVLSLPKSGEQPLLNKLYIKEGRLPSPERETEIVVNESFAKANNFTTGSQISAVIHGNKRKLTIVGLALSPEFIYALGPGDMVPDDKRFGIIWMGYNAASAAFDVKGAFNSLTLQIRRDANSQDVVSRLDQLLEKYGGVGAYGRADQLSHAFIDSELLQLRAMSRIVPPIFIAVAAFLINMTLTRLISMEREQIGLLKALGYGRIAIAMHYIKFVCAISLIGIAIGFVAGIWLGRGMTALYAEFFHFPFFVFLNPPEIFIISAGIIMLSALVGALKSVWSAVNLSPAVAMSPPVPTRYSHGMSENRLFKKIFSQSDMMIIRHLLRFPFRAFMTMTGIAAACGLLVMSLSTTDAINYMVDVTYFQTMRQDVIVAFSDYRNLRAKEDLIKLPGVINTEPFRAVSVILRNGHLKKRLSITGLPPQTDLQKVLDLNLKPVIVPESGLILSEVVAKKLNLRVGDPVVIDVQEGRRRQISVPVAGVLQSYLGLSAYMDLTALNALLGDGQVISGANLAIDSNRENALYAELKETPIVSAIAFLKTSLKAFRTTLGQNITIMMTVYVLLSVVITFGVVYNSARIQLSERGRELASLRVLGFTTKEVSRILLTEIAVVVFLAIPLGLLMGYGFAWTLYKGFESDLYRVPFIIQRFTFTYASLIVLVVAALSAALVALRISRLNLISVLKTRE